MALTDQVRADTQLLPSVRRQVGIQTAINKAEQPDHTKGQ